jgi:hypothetical protein
MALKNAVALNLSLLPNTATGTSSPFELRVGHRFPQHVKHGYVKIGDTAMVLEGSATRYARAATHAQTKQATPKGQLGICFGFSATTPGSYNFLLASGRIVPCRILTLVNVANPFGFKTRVVYKARLEHSSVTVALPPSNIIDPLSSSTVEPTAIEIMSHTGTKPRTAEYEVQYSDGDVVYHHYPDIQDDPLTPPYIAAHFPSVSRRSNRLATIAADLDDPDQSPFVLIASRSTSAPATPPASLSGQKSTLKLPAFLDFASDDDADEADIPDANFTCPVSRPPIAKPVVDDLAWYSPVTSPPPALPADLDNSLFPSSIELAPQQIAHNLNSKQAYAAHPIQAAAATAIEMNKYFGNRETSGYSVCDLTKPVAECDIPDGALKQYNRIFYRQKFNADGSSSKFTARCYTDGSKQPPSTYYETYAGTCATSDKFVMVAGYTAMAAQLDLTLDFFDLDVPGAFLQSRLTPENTPQDCYIQFAGDIRHTCAGKWFKRNAGTYGAKDSNHLFDTELVLAFAAAQFYPNVEQPKIFSRIHPTDPTLSCSVSMQVDDGLGCCTYRPYKDELRKTLEKRFGTITWNDHASSNTGFNFQRFNDGSITIDQHGYENRMLQDLGATDLPPVDRASLDNFFDPPTDLTPVSVTKFRTIIGSLIHLLPTWPKLRKEIVYLSTRQSTAVQSDMDKAIRVLAYINAHRMNYVRFSGTDTQVYLWADASPNAHSTGHSHGGYYITVGLNSGAVSASSRIENECIAQNASEAEYIVLARAGKEAVHYRRLLHSMGILQTQPITAYDDSQSAINLTMAPAVTKKSKHIHVRYHLIRDYSRQGIVRMVKVPGTDNPADLLTKTLSLPLAARYGDVMQNTSLSPLVPLGEGGSVR